MQDTSLPSENRLFSTPWGATALALAIYAAAAAISRLVPWLLGLSPDQVVLKQVLLKSLLIGFSLLAIRYLNGGTWADYGFQRPTSKVRWWPVILTGLALGIFATALLQFLSSKGNPLVAQLSLWQIVVVVWFYSSFSEEIFTRGWLQGALRRYEGRFVSLAGMRFSIPVLTSAVVFGLMHLSLLLVGSDIAATAITIVFAALLGLAAGTYRERYQSLVPAFWVHVLFNIGGVLTGIAFVVYRVKVLGQPLPAMFW